MTLKDVGCYNFRVVLGSRLSLTFNTMVLEDLKLIGLDIAAEYDEETGEEKEVGDTDDEENGDDNGMDGDDELL